MMHVAGKQRRAPPHSQARISESVEQLGSAMRVSVGSCPGNPHKGISRRHRFLEDMWHSVKTSTNILG